MRQRENCRPEGYGLAEADLLARLDAAERPESKLGENFTRFN
jgi:hypothetical protein